MNFLAHYHPSLTKLYIEQPQLHRVCYLYGVGPVDNIPFTNLCRSMEVNVGEGSRQILVSVCLWCFPFYILVFNIFFFIFLSSKCMIYHTKYNLVSTLSEHRPELGSVHIPENQNRNLLRDKVSSRPWNLTIK